ncbi:MAG: glycoside hydrolase family 88 protein [Bacteroidota bacterium]
MDALDWFPEDHPKRKTLIDILNRLVNAIAKVQDPKTGLWLDILNYKGPGKQKNYFEASASSQFCICCCERGPERIYHARQNHHRYERIYGYYKTIY